MEKRMMYVGERMNIPEKVIQKHIIEYLRFTGAVAGKTKTTGVYDAKRRCFRKDPMLFSGFPDLAFFYKKTFGFVEVKSKTGKQSDEQRMFEKLCNDSGIIYILAKSVDDVRNILEKI